MDLWVLSWRTGLGLELSRVECNFLIWLEPRERSLAICLSSGVDDSAALLMRPAWGLSSKTTTNKILSITSWLFPQSSHFFARLKSLPSEGSQSFLKRLNVALSFVLANRASDGDLQGKRAGNLLPSWKLFTLTWLPVSLSFLGKYLANGKIKKQKKRRKTSSFYLWAHFSLPSAVTSAHVTVSPFTFHMQGAAYGGLRDRNWLSLRNAVEAKYLRLPNELKTIWASWMWADPSSPLLTC